MRRLLATSEYTRSLYTVITGPQVPVKLTTNGSRRAREYTKKLFLNWKTIENNLETLKLISGGLRIINSPIQPFGLCSTVNTGKEECDRIDQSMNELDGVGPIDN